MSFPAWHNQALPKDRDQAVLFGVDADTEMAIAVSQARNTIAAAAAQADAVLSCMLGALPIYDATDTDFRAQLRYATRAGVIADLLRFGQWPTARPGQLHYDLQAALHSIWSPSNSGARHPAHDRNAHGKPRS